MNKAIEQCIGLVQQAIGDVLERQRDYELAQETAKASATAVTTLLGELNIAEACLSNARRNLDMLIKADFMGEALEAGK